MNPKPCDHYVNLNHPCEECEAVNHPRHYTSHPSGIEAIEICRHMGFNLGNVMKYLFRKDHKGVPLEDLKKAAWYLNDEIELIERGQRAEG